MPVQLAVQPGAEAVAERIAGGEDDDRESIGLRGADPFRDGAQCAVHIAHRCFGRQVRAHQIERPAGADDDARGFDPLACGVGQAGPAVVENADQAARSLTRFHKTSSSSTRTMNWPSKSQASTASWYEPG